MHLNDYQHEAMSFRLDSADEAYALFGMVGEVGELYGYIAKVIRDGEMADHQEYVKKELGDILWFLSAIAYDHGLQLDEIAMGNIQKLRSRKERGTIQGSGDDR
jgi:NTP pyrophosphatase (non-canonical NTP hydrolase)